MEKVEVSKEFILELHNEIIWPSVKAKIEKEFPQLFETKLGVGKWYKNGDAGWEKSIACVFEVSKEDKDAFSGYGFNGVGKWAEDFDFAWASYNWIPATPEEVETALVNEAKKRGFKEGVYYCFGGKKIEAKGEIRFNHQGKYNDLYFERSERFIFKDGKWAEILPQPIKMTVAEVEAKLGHAVEIVK